MKNVNFGLGIATGTEGLMYPIPYASAREVVESAVYAEQLGFDSVWGNDHISTQHYVAEEFGSAPRYYAPLMILAAIAERTTKLKVATALCVLPFRNPVVLAKEIATLDHLSGGRLLLGVGIGAYREEFEAEFGEKAKDIKRGEMLDENIEIMQRLFNEDRVSYQGKYYDIYEVQSFPKPIQKPFAFYFGGNAAQGIDRTVKYGTGWLPAVLTPEEVANGVSQIKEKCAATGRPFDIDIAPQLTISIARTHEEAIKKYENSQTYKHIISLGKSTMKGRDATAYMERNLIGSPDEIIARIEKYLAAGVTTFSALIFANNTLEETKEDMQLFSETVIKHYKG